MTDPERISKRSLGLAAQLLQAGADEQPDEASVRQTLVALGVSAAVVTTTSAASAVAGGLKASSALGAGGGVFAGAGSAGLGAAAGGTAVKAVSATLLVKWIGIGVVSGVGLAGVAAVATGPESPAAAHGVTAARAPEPAQAPAPQTTLPKQAALDLPRPSTDTEIPSVPAAPPAPASVSEPDATANEPVAAAPPLEVGAPLAAEVAYVDRARALLVAGRADQGLALLRSYERDFPEARLLPEVLFLQLETCDRLGRPSEARAAAQRLLEGFPKSPHASRARKLLFP